MAISRLDAGWYLFEFGEARLTCFGFPRKWLDLGGTYLTLKASVPCGARCCTS